jgi:hypothetical protein
VFKNGRGLGGVPSGTCPELYCRAWGPTVLAHGGAKSPATLWALAILPGVGAYLIMPYVLDRYMSFSFAKLLELSTKHLKKSQPRSLAHRSISEPQCMSQYNVKATPAGQPVGAHCSMR